MTQTTSEMQIWGMTKNQNDTFMCKSSKTLEIRQMCFGSPDEIMPKPRIMT